MFLQQFGGKISKQLVSQYEQSNNWKKGRFRNLDRTNLGPGFSKIPGIIYKQLRTRENKAPTSPLVVAPFSKDRFTTLSDTAKFIWYGHSVIFMRMQGKNILIDPMLGPDCAPIAPVQNKRFSENTLDLIDDFPEIDLILFTHDHYDHLDYASIQKLKHKCKQYFVAMGLKRHLVKWGIDAELITEMDWWNQINFNNIQITFTPTRHFSGRGLSDRMKCLWGGWALQSPNENIWFSGDGGYGNHFKEIGNRLGPFDFAFMECGQYNNDWYDIHLFPHESIQAALDASVKKAMPIHWAGFDLSYEHTWTGPAEDFVRFSEEKGLEYMLPKLGEIYAVNNHVLERWWE